jgi:hypothetical protein
MKLLVLAFIALFSVASFAGDQVVDCKDRKGNVLDKSLDNLNQIRNSRQNRPQVYVEGQVSQILPEDKAGLPHQKYIIKAFNSVKIVVVSNLDFGRIPVQVGSTVSVCGEYINAEGGMVHWTHFDPHGGHPDGFTVMNGKLYGDTEQN